MCVCVCVCVWCVCSSSIVNRLVRLSCAFNREENCGRKGYRGHERRMVMGGGGQVGYSSIFVS